MIQWMILIPGCFTILFCLIVSLRKSGCISLVLQIELNMTALHYDTGMPNDIGNA